MTGLPPKGFGKPKYAHTYSAGTSIPAVVVSTPEEADKLLVIDVSNLAHRAFHGYQLTTSDGRFSGHVYGALTMLISTLNHNVGSGRVCIVFCYDGCKSSAKRKVMMPEYKSTRDPSKFNPTTEVKRVLKTLPGLHVELDEREADDGIAWVAGKFLDKEVVVLSGDRDLWALLRHPNVKMLSPKLVTPEDVTDKFGVNHPGRIPLAKALYGDASDGIKGVARLPRAKINPIINLDDVWTVEDFYKALDSIELTGTAKPKLLAEKERVALNFKVIAPDLDGFSDEVAVTVRVSVEARTTLERQLDSFECRKLFYQIGVFFGAPIYSPTT